MTRKNVNSAHPNPNGEINSRRKYRSSTRNRTRLLYHRRVSRPSGRTTRRLLIGLAILAGATVTSDRPSVAGGPPDRLDQFRRLALSGRSMWQAVPDAPSDGNGGLFASPAFLKDRLDAFSEAWGAVAVGVVRVGTFVGGDAQRSDAPV